MEEKKEQRYEWCPVCCSEIIIEEGTPQKCRCGHIVLPCSFCENITELCNWKENKCYMYTEDYKPTSTEYRNQYIMEQLL